MDDLLLERIRNTLLVKEVDWIEKSMMGGTTFMVDDKMCFGTFKDGILFRIDPEEKDVLLEKSFTEVMHQGGREMKGYVHVSSPGYESDKELDFWISKCIEFNPKARSSKKKKIK